MKSKVFLLPLFALGILGMNLPVIPEADIETRDGREEASSKMLPVDTLLSFNLKRLDPIDGLRAIDETSTDKAEATLAASLSTYRASSDNSIFELEGLLKRDITSFRRVINLSLKSAVHGITGTFTWIVQISIDPDQKKSWLGPHRLGAQAAFDQADSTPGTDATTFSARELHHSANNWLTAWRLKLTYNPNNSHGYLIPDINWQEAFSSFSNFWGAAPAGIQSTVLQWTKNGRVETIDQSLYDITISP